LAAVVVLSLSLALAGCGGAKSGNSSSEPAPATPSTSPSAPAVTIAAGPRSVLAGGASALTVTATDATAVSLSGSDGSNYALAANGGTQSVTPAATTTYTATASGPGGSVSATATVTVTEPPTPPPAPAVTIAANPASIVPGGSSKLTVTATQATAVSLSGSDGSNYALPANGGTQIVSPAANATYIVSATGPGGKASATAMVAVTAPPPPVMPTITLAALPGSILAGSSSALTVSASYAAAVTLSGSDGSSYTLSANGGTQTVSPVATTTYTASATGPGGKAYATTTVTVTGPPAPQAPTVTLTATPSSIIAGSSSALAVTATHATAVTLTGSDGSSYLLSANGGTQTVSPAANTTYTASATGPGGTASATTAVTVTQPAATVTIVASRSSIAAGDSMTLSVTATHATAVTLTGSDGSSYVLSANGGTQTVSPAANTTYTASATGPGGTASATTAVSVTQPAATVTIMASHSLITAGDSVTLTVTATHATAVTLSGSDGSSYTLSANGGTQTVSPAANTTYTASATGSGGNASASALVTVTKPSISVTIVASPTMITSGDSSTLTVTAANATAVTLTGSDGSSYPLAAIGGTQTVTPSSTTTYTAEASGAAGSDSASVIVNVSAVSGANAIRHVIFMLQENRTFDNYFGMLNPYRRAQQWNVGDDGNVYDVDGIEDKLNLTNTDDEGVSHPLFPLKTTCIDDATTPWTESYLNVNRSDFLATRSINLDGFVHNAEVYAKGCVASPSSACSGAYTDTSGQRAMGYYDEGFLNYYYYMASQFAVSDRWFSPIANKTHPNRIATYSGGTTQGLVFDPGSDDNLGTLDLPSIFQALDSANVSWKVYYSATQGNCGDTDDCGSGPANYPATTLGYIKYTHSYLYQNSSGAACTGTTQPSSVVGDPYNYFCIDPNHIAPLSTYFTDLINGTLPSFAFIEPAYGNNDEHPSSYQPILLGQTQMARIINAFMASPEWKDGVFFFSYDEGGGLYDHVPPVPQHSNDNTDLSLGTIPDIASIAVNPDGYAPCLPSSGVATKHCDLRSDSPGAHAGDAAAVNGFGAQIGFRVPNIVISPFTRRHYVSHIPMDHTAIIKFVEDLFIGNKNYLTARDAAQPNLLDFFDFKNTPWATPPIPPVPVSKSSLGSSQCNPATM
jgi:phospholipase C